MKAVAGVLHGTIEFEPTRQQDGLGFVSCTFDAEVACTAGLDARDLVQEVHTRTRRGGVRGLHLRTDGGDGKLVRCTHEREYEPAQDSDYKPDDESTFEPNRDSGSESDHKPCQTESLGHEDFH